MLCPFILTPGTVELGGMLDTEPDVCAASCEAILAFLCDNNYVARSVGLSDFPVAPPPTCDATPLAGVHEVMPPHAGENSSGHTMNLQCRLPCDPR
jgi:hypothetical protein